MTTLQQIELRCPICDTRFRSQAVVSTNSFGGKRTDTETFYSFSSCATPPTIYKYDLITGTSRLLRRRSGPQ